MTVPRRWTTDPPLTNPQPADILPAAQVSAPEGTRARVITLAAIQALVAGLPGPPGPPGPPGSIGPPGPAGPPGGDLGEFAMEAGRRGFFISGGGFTTAFTALAAMPALTGDGVSIAFTGGDHIFALRGGNTTDFWRYSIAGNSWLAMAAAPSAVFSGGGLVFAGGDHIYARPGNNNNAFWRYNIAANTWTVLAVVPGTSGMGMGLVWAGGDYIFTRSDTGTSRFWRYSISGNAWVGRAGQAAWVNGAVVYGGRDHLFALAGGTNGFNRYRISTDAWEARTNLPEALWGGDSIVYTGGDFIYVIPSAQSPNFLRYSITGNSWLTLPQGVTVVNNSAMTYNGRDFIYAHLGGSTFARATVLLPDAQLAVNWQPWMR